LKAIGAAVVGKGAEKGAKLFSVDETGQGLANLAATTMIALTGKPNVYQFRSELYHRVRDSLPQNARVDAGPLLRQIGQHTNDALTHGIDTPTKRRLQGVVDQINGMVDQNGTVSVRDLWQTVSDINDIVGDPSSAQGLDRLLNPVRRSVNDRLQQYGRQNRQFGRNLRSANTAYAAVEESNKLRRFFTKNAAVMGGTSLATIAIMGQGDPAKTAKLATVMGAAGVGTILYRIANSPALARHYGRVLSAAGRENASVAANEMRKFDEALRKNLRNDPIEGMDEDQIYELTRPYRTSQKEKQPQSQSDQ
jgi:hypothetical protein